MLHASSVLDNSLLPIPEYQLIVSSRARRASLKVLPGKGLVVTVPRRFPKQDIAGFIESHRDWIDASLADIEARTPVRFRQWPPRELALPALGVSLQLCYGSCEALESDTVKTIHRSMSAAAASRSAVAQEIAQHLKKLARSYLRGWSWHVSR